jgi:uncharacterized repeat protein (TIGR03806 family)
VHALRRLVFAILISAQIFGLDAAAARIPVALHAPVTKPTSGLGIEEAFGAVRFNQPVAIVTPPGETNRVFIVERMGTIAVITNLANPNRTVFLDVSSKTVSFYEETGLLGLAFHPGFATNGYFYIYWTPAAPDFQNQLSRFQVASDNPNRADAGSEVVLISQEDTEIHHNGGGLEFGPDGYLYLAIGCTEPTPEYRAPYGQAIDRAFFSSMIRIDVDKRPGSLPPTPGAGSTTNYAVPPDNPWVGATSFMGRPIDANRLRTELFAVGLRQPFKFCFDSQTGELILGDVGESTWEEIDVIKPGKNYGYPFFEANSPLFFPELAPPMSECEAPIFVYGHGTARNDVGSAVIGGMVCRNSNIAELEGSYVFGDYISGNIWKLNRTGAQVTAEWLAREMAVSCFGRDPRNGALLLANVADGAIRVLVKQGPEDSEVPNLLSETGVFSDLETLTVKPGVEPYEINVPFWSDHAIKQRWFALPDTNTVYGFSEEGPWRLPTGAVWIKHFELELRVGDPTSRRRLETRLLVKSPTGIFGYTYRWGDSPADATLVPASGLDETLQIEDHGQTREQTWHYPGRGECTACHSVAGGFALGFNTAQLNRPVVREGQTTNQLEWLAHAGYLDRGSVEPAQLRKLAAADDESQPLGYRVQSYFAANCANCHQPGGTALRMRWDARITSPIINIGLEGMPPIVDFHGGDEKLIKRLDPTNSVLLERLTLFDPYVFHMPPLATSVINDSGVNLVTRWVNTLLDASYLADQVWFNPLNGSAQRDGDLWTVGGAGLGFEDHFFVSRRLTGNAQIVAQIKSGVAGVSDALAGLEFRAIQAPWGASAMLAANSLGENKVFIRRELNGPTLDPISSDAGAKTWLRLVRNGGQVSAWDSFDGSAWNLIANEDVNLPDEAMAGLAVSSGDIWKYAVVAFDPVQMLSVSLSAKDVTPTDSPSKIFSLDAALFADGTTVRRMEFFADGKSIGSLVQPPWNFQWTNAWAGQYMVTATVTDENGLSLNSNPVQMNLPDGAPRLEIASGIVNLTLQWLAPAAGYTLWRAATLSGTWEQINDGIEFAGDRYRYTIEATGLAGYFQLRK